MASRTRIAILAFAALGLAASAYALYVHYQLISDPAYAPLCNVGDSVSCTQVFQSQYGSAFGVPVAAGGAIWSALVLLLAALGLDLPNRERSARIAGHIFLLSTVGLAAVFYFAYASFFILGTACLVCITMYVSVIGVFIASAMSAGSLGAALANLTHDLGALQRSQTAVTLGVAWLAASIALVAFFPREQVVEAAPGEVAGPAPAPTETLTPEQLGEWEKWLDEQPRVDAMLPTGDAKVRVVKFNDYQCPSCRQAWTLYESIFLKYEASHPGTFVYEKRDFPLETECGSGGVHGAACEAAAAVRMAKEKGQGLDKKLEAVLFDRQSAAMTRDDVEAALKEVAQIDDFDARYEALLPEIRKDVALGQEVQVSGTPTIFVNGIRFPNVRPSYIDAAIAIMLKKAGA
jgi:uncharacterized membrane protein/protein-disulfide isomerase